MEIKPIENYKTPLYPKKEEILRNPNLLKTLPERWRGNAYVAVALSSLLFMTLTACSNKDGGNAKIGKPVPIFIHGDGRGSFGCISVAPPAFLSEDEAFDVISEEAKKEGIIFEKNATILENVKIPKTDTFYSPSEEEKSKKMGTVEADLTLDGFDKVKHIGYEFVSKDDIHEWADKNQNMWSSVEKFEFLSTADTLSQGVKDKTGDKMVAVFYDPHYKFDSKDIKNIISKNKDDYTKMENELKEHVKVDLREQVKDFINWLKGQGMI